MEITIFHNHVWDMLHNLSERMESLFRPLCDTYGLTPVQMRALLELRLHGEQTVGALSKKLCMAAGNTSAMCKRLEKSGFLKRLRDQQDERIVRVGLSERGNQTILEMDHTLFDRYAEILEDVPKDQLSQIECGLKNLNELLQRMGDVSLL